MTICDHLPGDDGIAVLTVPADAGEALAGAVADLAAAPSLRGVIVHPRASRASDDWENTRALGAALQALEKLPVPKVAVLAESVADNAFAIALACQHRIASARGDRRIGQAAVANRFPGAGACVRLVRLLGLEAAFALLLAGFALDAAGAREQGLVDELSEPAQLDAAARAWIAASADAAPRWPLRPLLISGNPPGAQASPPALLAWVQNAPARLARDHGGAVPPAARALLAAAVESLQVDFDTALQIEARYDLALRSGV